MSLHAPFPAFRIHNDDTGYRSGVEQLTLDQLSGKAPVKKGSLLGNFDFKSLLKKKEPAKQSVAAD